MDTSLVTIEQLPDAWRQTVHGVSMSRDEYDLSREIEDDLKSDEAAAIISAILIGQKLVNFKEKLGHGRFGVWRRCRFGEKDRTCQRNMLMARHFGSRPDAVAHLSLTLMRDVLKKENWLLLGERIKSDIDEGKKLDASDLRASLPSKSRFRRRENVSTPSPNSEEEIVNVIVETIRKYDKSVRSIISSMDQGRLGEMIIERVLTET